MNAPYLLHIFSPTKYVSPFDINMAYEANFDAVIPYCNVTLAEVHALTQDTIFSRRPDHVQHTGIFIGGRDLGEALAMMDAARDAMVPPFEVSVMVDPSGAITTAAAMLAAAEARLLSAHQCEIAGARIFVFGGTGPVGTCVALLGAMRGAEVTIVSHQGAGAAQLVADRLSKQYEIDVQSADGSKPAAVASIMRDAEVVFNTAKAGIQVVDTESLREAQNLLLAVDANAVPPSGIAGVASTDAGVAIDGGNGRALGIGALAIGDIKYRVHTALLQRLYESQKPVYLAYAEAFDTARDIITQQA